MGAPGFSRGTATPTRAFEEAMEDDPSAGYGELRPIVVGGTFPEPTSSVAATSAASSSVPLRPVAVVREPRPQTFAGGMLPETFLRLTEPIPPPSSAGASFQYGHQQPQFQYPQFSR